jgi:hypothetical protein
LDALMKPNALIRTILDRTPTSSQLLPLQSFGYALIVADACCAERRQGTCKTAEHGTLIYKVTALKT